MKTNKLIGEKMIKEVKERASIGVYQDTKDRLDNLVAMLNHNNRESLGDKAKKITRDDVINELVEAYTAVGVK